MPYSIRLSDLYLILHHLDYAESISYDRHYLPVIHLTGSIMHFPRQP